MIPDIFSTFDPNRFNSSTPSSIFMIINFLILTISLTFWSTSNRLYTPLIIIRSIITQQLLRTITRSIKGLTRIIASLFIIIILINLLGIVPYVFSTSSHLYFTLLIGLPLWLLIIISRLSHWPKIFIAHFLPDGAPDWLNPFLVLIESSSITVRPLTLSFRLAANISAGHIVLALISLYAAVSLFTSLPLAIILLITTLFYILFELCICVIQSYIFCLLLSLYSEDHTH